MCLHRTPRTDPLAGRRPPEPGQLGGQALMLVHYVADLVGCGPP